MLNMLKQIAGKLIRKQQKAISSPTHQVLANQGAFCPPHESASSKSNDASLGKAYPTNRFKFSIEKQLGNVDSPTLLSAVQHRTVASVREFFPYAFIEVRIEAAAGDRSISSWHSKFFVIISLADSSMPKDEFEETLADLKHAIKTF